MKQKIYYNNTVRFYNRSRRKLKNLIEAGKNLYKQDILRKRIARLFNLLTGMQQALKMGAAAVTLTAGMVVSQSNVAEAQSFPAWQTNPFSLTSTPNYYSKPSFADLDNDGDLDILSGDAGGKFYYFQNTGTNISPVFAAAQINPFSLTDIGNASAPTFADLDNDGDMDMMSGDANGNLRYFQNTGTNTSPVFAAAQTNPFSLTAVYYNSTPAFADLDNDGDLDLMVGTWPGDLIYFENTGTNTSPAFAAAQTNPFSLIDINNLSTPTFADLDNDGDLDLMVGNDGGFSYFENTGTNVSPAFAAPQTNPFSLTNVNQNAPAFADLDNDGDLDLMVGAYHGTFFYFENTGAIMWDGSASTDWNTAANWSSNAVPIGSDIVLIPSAPSNQPHVTLAPATPAVCTNLTVRSGATLTVDAGKALTASGVTDNEGTILVKADATGIGSFIDNGTITGAGSFQMEQYLTGAGGATPNGVFYYVSSPVASATSNVYSAAGTDKLWSADETTQTYPEITDNATSLNVTEGYIARLGATATETFTGGAFNTGNQSASGLTRTGAIAANRGYNLVGNPYPSTVSWDAATKTNLETTMWYRTHQGSTMTYDTYNATSSIGTNNNGNGMVTGAIAPTQAFWVKVDADGNTGQLNFTNAMRSHGTLAGIYRMAAEEGTVRMTLSNGTNSDEAILLFDENADDAFDAYDSHKFWAAASVPQIYMNEAEDSLVINGLYSTATNPIVDLGVKLPTSGNYTLNANDITVVGETVHLEDRLLNIFQDLNVEPNYSFTSMAGNIGDRFALHFGMAVTGIGRDAINRVSTQVYTSYGNTLNIILSDNTENGKAYVMDMAGRTVGSFNLNATRTSVDMNVSTGVYLIRVETEKGTDTHRIVIN